MKTISLPWFIFWMCCLGVVVFVVVRCAERTTALQGDVGDLKERVNELEMRNIRHEERWGWISRIGSRIPLVKCFFRRD
jgi:hypothetical protein